MTSGTIGKKNAFLLHSSRRSTADIRRRRTHRFSSWQSHPTKNMSVTKTHENAPMPAGFGSLVGCSALTSDTMWCHQIPEMKGSTSQAHSHFIHKQLVPQVVRASVPLVSTSEVPATPLLWLSNLFQQPREPRKWLIYCWLQKTFWVPQMNRQMKRYIKARCRRIPRQGLLEIVVWCPPGTWARSPTVKLSELHTIGDLVEASHRLGQLPFLPFLEYGAKVGRKLQTSI